MMQQIMRFFVQPALDEQDRALKAKQFHRILWMDVVISLCLYVIFYSTGYLRFSISMIGLALANTGLGLWLIWLLHKGRGTKIGYAFIFYKILFLTGILVELNANILTIVSGYVLFVIAAGLMFQRRWLIITTCLTGVAVTLLLFAGLPVVDYAVVLCILVYAAGFTDWAQGNIAQSLNRANLELAERKRVEVDLAQARHDLEQQIQARTEELFAVNQSLEAEITERRQVADALRRSMAELVTLMDVTPGVVYMYREDGKLERWNRRFLDVTGYSEEELVQMSPLDLIYPDDWPAAEALLAMALAEGQAEAELRICSKDGQTAVYYTAGARLVDDAGQRYFAGVGVDITNLFVTEAALRESEERYRNLVEAIPDIILVSDFTGRLLYTTPALERHTGLTIPDLQILGGPVQGSAAYIPDDSDHMQQAIQDFIQDDRPYSDMIENRLTGKDSQPHWYSSILSRVQFQGQPALQVVSRDITEQKLAEEAFFRVQKRLRALLDATTDATFLMAPDGTFLAVNEATARTYGTPAAELVGRSGFDSLPDDLASVRWTKFRQVVETLRPVRFEDYGLNGWSDNSLYPVMAEGGVVEAVAVFSRDINEQKLAEESLRQSEAHLRESEERYALAARGANDGLWDLNLRSGQIYLSPRWKSMLGYPEEEGRDDIRVWLRHVHPEDQDRLLARMDAHLQGITPYFECEFRLQHRDGTYRWVLTRGLAVRDDSGKAYRAAGSMTDITDSKRIEEQLVHDAFHDVLTGLPNRALLADRLELAIRQKKRYEDYHYAVLYLDLDRFKDVNDSHGHNAGDRLLMAAAERMQTCMRSADTLARLGGDEFVILQTEVRDAQDAITLAARLQDEFNRPFLLQDGMDVAHTSASIGIVLGDTSYLSAEEILRDADIAMYRAKEQGRACFQVFDESMRSQVLARVRLETELRQAILQHELQVYYHPILSLETGRFTGFEALVRWRHPARGIISPADFIPLAEDCLLVIPLDRWVMEEACRQVKEWQEQTGFAIKISVNLSRRQFLQDGLIDAVRNILYKTRLRPEDLVVEITESIVMENYELATVTLRELQGLGVKVEFDDFGSGYSSLTQILKLPVNTLKLEKILINPITTDSRTAGIVRNIVRLGHDIGLDVVAEGVETHAQLQDLKEMGCDFAQGYLFSQPMDSITATQWVREQWVEWHDGRKPALEIVRGMA